MTTTLPLLRSLPVMSALLVLAATTVCSIHAQILGYDVNFNGSSATYTDNFRKANDAAAVGFIWGAGVGTGGTGGLTVTNTQAVNLFYRPTPTSDATSTFDFANFAAGTKIVSTTDFLWSNTSSTTLTVLTAGLVGSNATDNALTSASALAGSLIRTGSSDVTLRMRNGTANAQTLDFSQSSLSAGSWYQLSYELTKSATANTFDYVVSLYYIGLNGTSAPVLFNDGTKNITISGTLTNANSIYNDSTAFFAYDIRNAGANLGINAVDNFHVAAVPEPTTVALIGLGLLGFAAARRFRRQS